MLIDVHWYWFTILKSKTWGTHMSWSWVECWKREGRQGDKRWTNPAQHSWSVALVVGVETRWNSKTLKSHEIHQQNRKYSMEILPKGMWLSMWRWLQTSCPGGGCSKLSASVPIHLIQIAYPKKMMGKILVHHIIYHIISIHIHILKDIVHGPWWSHEVPSSTHGRSPGRASPAQIHCPPGDQAGDSLGTRQGTSHRFRGHQYPLGKQPHGFVWK